MDYIHIGTRKYNPDKSTFICNTPTGVLYQKKGKSQEYFLYNSSGKTNKEKIIPITWPEASDLVQKYGSREVYISQFTTYSASKTATPTKRRSVYLDDYHYIKAQRNALRMNLSVKEYICRLIEKDDANNNWRH